MSIQAAIRGVVVVLGREPPVIDALADGRLALPFPVLTPSEYSYRPVCNRHTADEERIGIFTDWLLEEIAAQPDIAARLRAAGIASRNEMRRNASVVRPGEESASFRCEAPVCFLLRFFTRSVAIRSDSCRPPAGIRG